MIAQIIAKIRAVFGKVLLGTDRLHLGTLC